MTFDAGTGAATAVDGTAFEAAGAGVSVVLLTTLREFGVNAWTVAAAVAGVSFAGAEAGATATGFGCATDTGLALLVRGVVKAA